MQHASRAGRECFTQNVNRAKVVHAMEVGAARPELRIGREVVDVRRPAEGEPHGVVVADVGGAMSILSSGR